MTVKGSCHCGATQFTVAKRPDSVTRCTCSFCSKRGALWAYYENESDFVLTTSRDRVSTYQWRSYSVEHHHCAICGCGTYSEFPDFSSGTPDYSNPRISVNARLLDDFDVEALPQKRVDGKNAW